MGSQLNLTAALIFLTADGWEPMAIFLANIPLHIPNNSAHIA